MQMVIVVYFFPFSQFAILRFFSELLLNQILVLLIVQCIQLKKTHFNLP